MEMRFHIMTKTQATSYEDLRNGTCNLIMTRKDKSSNCSREQRKPSCLTTYRIKLTTVGRPWRARTYGIITIRST
jgi:hypothetical protein